MRINPPAGGQVLRTLSNDFKQIPIIQDTLQRVEL
jgi:hypothetical protein